ncbi:transposase [Thioalkalivibrio sp. ALJ24]|uniref:IS66 family transposase n=1 Tax=Thioalkalivibrio sp. ALJ24 TaxID=545276 RepID=UPI000366FC52|nr:transposase [Thioalkalivibrio sp. ALJ24]
MTAGFGGHRGVERSCGRTTGTLISDGYSAYARFAEAAAGLTHAQCWAHTRREFLAAEASEPAGGTRALESLRALYTHAAAIRDRRLAPDKALASRAEQSYPVVDAFVAWFHEH